MKTNKFIIEFCKAQLSSLFSTMVDFVVTAILFQFFGIYYIFSTFIGSVSGGCVNFVINHKWVFRNCNQSKCYAVLKYMIVWSGSILLNTAGTAIGVKFCPDWTGSELDVVVVVKLIVAIIVAVFWNYIMQKYFVFSDLLSKRNQSQIL